MQRAVVTAAHGQQLSLSQELTDATDVDAQLLGDVGHGQPLVHEILSRRRNVGVDHARQPAIRRPAIAPRRTLGRVHGSPLDGLRGRLLSPTVEPDPGHAGEGRTHRWLQRLPSERRAMLSSSALVSSGWPSPGAVRQRGCSVLVVDPAPGAAASQAAAGMLAPVTELHYGEEALLRLNVESARRYPAFVAELEDAARASVGYRSEGTLAVAFDADDRAVLADLHAFQAALGLDVETLTGREARRLEPMLDPRVRSALHVRSDHSVDNRRLVRALLFAVQRAGVRLVQQRVDELTIAHEGVRGVRAAGTVHEAALVVLAAGSWSGSIGGLPDELLPPIRPVKGQILRLRTSPAGQGTLLTRTVRGFVRGSGVYLVPRADGEIVVGATVEERGFDDTVTAGAVYQLLRDAHELVPAVTELILAEAAASHRPGSPDNAPLIGPGRLPGLILATGHYRNGIMLAPVTADLIADLVTTGSLPDEAAPFSPARFDRIGAHA